MILFVSLQFRQLAGPVELSAASRLLTEVFGSDGEEIPVDLLTAIACSGGFVGGALLDGDLVGVAVGFGEISPPGVARPAALHSHVAAVSQAARGMRVGQQLKWYQREWALERDVRVIHWTFDPLVRRNAVLNLNRLGAVADTYRRDLYGPIPDALNRGMESDRLVVRWELDSPRVLAALRRSGPAGRADGPAGTIETPADIESLLLEDPLAAQQWRHRQRQAFASLPDGWTVTGVDPDGRYQMEFP